MSDKDKFKGTGDLIAQLGPLKIYDDGDNDHFVNRVIEHDGQEYGSFKRLRRSVGDAKFKEILDESSSSSVSADDFEPREPVAFKCDRCNETYPRTMKAREGVCTNCS